MHLMQIRYLNAPYRPGPKICLKKQTDDQIVQYGIVQLNFNHLDRAVQDEIVSQERPLGRILIENDVMRRVKLLSLYQIRASEYLKSRLQCDCESVFGRTAIIFCNDEPANARAWADCR